MNIDNLLAAAAPPDLASPTAARDLDVGWCRDRSPRRIEMPSRPRLSCTPNDGLRSQLIAGQRPLPRWRGARRLRPLRRQRAARSRRVVMLDQVNDHPEHAANCACSTRGYKINRSPTTDLRYDGSSRSGSSASGDPRRAPHARHRPPHPAPHIDAACGPARRQPCLEKTATGQLVSGGSPVDSTTPIATPPRRCRPIAQSASR